MGYPVRDFTTRMATWRAAILSLDQSQQREREAVGRLGRHRWRCHAGHARSAGSEQQRQGPARRRQQGARLGRHRRWRKAATDGSNAGRFPIASPPAELTGVAALRRVRGRHRSRPSPIRPPRSSGPHRQARRCWPQIKSSTPASSRVPGSAAPLRLTPAARNHPRRHGHGLQPVFDMMP